MPALHRNPRSRTDEYDDAWLCPNCGCDLSEQAAVRPGSATCPAVCDSCLKELPTHQRPWLDAVVIDLGEPAVGHAPRRLTPVDPCRPECGCCA
ncbi:MAG TPA: hypothetical protein VHV82_10775 [Sporichthyaceae bacterium]|jgi:hypothetical protein|nr:hypothetical protein [Sporichthyaceae bacterium]